MLDVWRGVICLLVVVEHAGVALWDGSHEGTGLEGLLRRALVWVLELNIGTPLFFVISGYCIASSIESSRRKGHGPIRFLARRVWRIFPTYWAALLGFVAVVAVLDGLGLTLYRQHNHALELYSPRELTFSQWVGNVTLTETWRQHVYGPRGFVFTRVAWSLCFQEQFYAVCCLVLWLTPGRLFRTLAWVTGAVLVYRMWIQDTGGLARYEGTFVYAWHEFAVGLAVYWRLNAGMSASRDARRTVELAVAALAVAGLATSYTSTAAAGLFGLLLIGLHRWDAVAGRQTWLDPLRACGRRSYSIYLTHLPVTVVGNALLFDLGARPFWTRVVLMVPAVTAASLGLAWAFHHVVEKRFLGAPPSWRAAVSRSPQPHPSVVPAVAVAGAA